MENNTSESFRAKWTNNPNLAFDETLKEGSEIFNWVLNRNGFMNGGDLSSFLQNKKRILDAGCGNGRITALLRNYSNPETTEVVGIDLVASQIAKENLAGKKNVSFYDADLLTDLSRLGKFDFIYCQEVLHHTSDPEQGFKNLVALLEPKGEIAIYVYKKKAPLREYTDDYIRDRISSLDYNEAMKACEQITALGKKLSEYKIDIDIPAVDILEIKEGTYDVQRFIYHFFMKCFWNNNLSFHDNAVINYDWYHPQNCSRHTMEEIKGWYVSAGLKIVHEFSDFYGITVRGVKS